MNIKAALTRKLGPLPAWGWGGIFAGLVLVYRRLRGSSSTTPGTGTGNTPDLTSTGNPAITGPFGTGGAGGADFTPTDQTTGGSTGPGTPVVYDPTSDGYPDVTPGYPSWDPGGQLVKWFSGSSPAEPSTQHGDPAAPAKAKKKTGSSTTPQRPTKTKGQITKRGGRTRTASTPAPELVSEHGGSVGKPPPAPARAQTKTKTTVSRPRADSTSHADTGARATAPELVSEHGRSAPAPAPVSKPVVKATPPPPPPKPKPPPPKPAPYLGRH